MTLKRIRGEYVAEVSIGKSQQRPKCVRFGKFRAWRWQVTYYRTTDPINPGVFEGRLHLGDDWDYTFTRRGAANAAARASNKMLTGLRERTENRNFGDSNG